MDLIIQGNKNKLRGQANYTDRVTAACQRS
jgi:hypothetical protein